MLNDYINDYNDAVQKHDKKTMLHIERELASLGMDKKTITVLAKEMIKKEK